MMYNTRDYRVSGLCPSSDILKNIKFGNWSCLRPKVKGWKAPTLLGQIEGPNLNPVGPLERPKVSHSISEAGSISVLR
jgi:hypothetical protein